MTLSLLEKPEPYEGDIMLDLLHLAKGVGLLLLAVTPLLQAHEYWIEPQRYQLSAGDRLVAQLKVGQHFKGDVQPYLPDNINRMQIHIGDTSSDVKSRIGDLPVLDQKLAGEGLVIVSLISNIFQLNYTEAGRFEQFLAYEGLQQVLAEHRRRGLPMTGFKEAYQRFAKSLVRLGKGGGEDRLLGMRFEWLLESNPYTVNTDLIQARLFWHDQPLPAAQARLFLRNGGNVQERVLTTDQSGRVTFSVEPGSEVLLNAVQMRQPAALFPAPADVVWISYWTTITFELPESVEVQHK